MQLYDWNNNRESHLIPLGMPWINGVVICVMFTVTSHLNKKQNKNWSDGATSIEDLPRRVAKSTQNFSLYINLTSVMYVFVYLFLCGLSSL